MSAKRTQPYRFGVPAKYTAGLSPAAAKRKAAEKATQEKKEQDALKEKQYRRQ